MSEPEQDPVKRTIQSLNAAFYGPDGKHAVANASPMSLSDAIEEARRTGSTEHLTDHWNKTRVALLHDVIQDYLDDPPAGLSPGTLVALESARVYLRGDLARLNGVES